MTGEAAVARLSVFAGGWTLEAAEQVCAGDGVEDGEVLDLLTSLADKSLVMVEQNDGHSRYRLLETVRQYARERLLESGSGEACEQGIETTSWRWRRRRNRNCWARSRPSGCERLEEEHDNLRSALEWSLSEAGSGGGLRLCGALQRFLVTRGYLSEGREWCARVLAKAGAERTSERAKALYAAGLLAYWQGDYPAARALHEECLAIWRQLGDRWGIGRR